MSVIKTSKIMHPDAESGGLELSPDGSIAFDGEDTIVSESQLQETLSALDTDDITEATNLYYTDARVDAVIAGSDTDDLSEGATNLYYTDARALHVAVDKTGDTMSGVLVAPNFYITLESAASDTVDLNFNSPAGFISRDLTGNLVFTGSNYVAGGIKSSRIINGGSVRTVTFPDGWVFVGPKPTDIAANKTAILTVTSFGTTEVECVAGWAVQL